MRSIVTVSPPQTFHIEGSGDETSTAARGVSILWIHSSFLKRLIFDNNVVLLVPTLLASGSEVELFFDCFCLFYHSLSHARKDFYNHAGQYFILGKKKSTTIAYANVLTSTTVCTQWLNNQSSCYVSTLTVYVRNGATLFRPLFAVLSSTFWHNQHQTIRCVFFWPWVE